MNIFRHGLLALSFALAACQPSAPATTPPLQGASIGGPFALTDQDGRAVTDRSFAGRYRIMYFGYTFCPDVCPTDAAVIGKALKQVEADKPDLGRRIVPIFVTVDPARDTPAALKSFVTNFHPRMVGLTGDPAAITKVQKEFAIFSDTGEKTAAGGYLMNHSTQSYLMDPNGKPLALLPLDQGPQAVATEIEKWAS
jgi:protein SCO1/2